jgi:hypothetical protein
MSSEIIKHTERKDHRKLAIVGRSLLIVGFLGLLPTIVDAQWQELMISTVSAASPAQIAQEEKHMDTDMLIFEPCLVAASAGLYLNIAGSKQSRK